jgi:hypothetical protein
LVDFAPLDFLVALEEDLVPLAPLPAALFVPFGAVFFFVDEE